MVAPPFLKCIFKQSFLKVHPGFLDREDQFLQSVIFEPFTFLPTVLVLESVCKNIEGVPVLQFDRVTGKIYFFLIRANGLLICFEPE